MNRASWIAVVVLALVGGIGGVFILGPNTFQAAFSEGRPVARKCPKCGEGMNLFTLTDEWLCNVCDNDHMKAQMESYVRGKQLATP